VDAVDGFALGKTHLIIGPRYQIRRCLSGDALFRRREDCALPARVPQCNAYAERFVRSIKEECLNRLVFLSENTSGQPSQFSSVTIANGAIIKDGKPTHRTAGVSAQSGPHPMPKTTRRMLNYYYREAA